MTPHSGYGDFTGVWSIEQIQYSTIYNLKDIVIKDKVQ